MIRVLLEKGFLIDNKVIGLGGIAGMSHEDIAGHGFLCFDLEVMNAHLVSNCRGVWVCNRDLESSALDTGLVVLE
ncbi:MAG: hypothetical protein ACE5H4_14415 [Candidatus Thorarchaeota archaeon]